MNTLDTFLLIIIFFVLGTLAQEFFKIAKNAVHILIVLILGWFVWQYIGPTLVPQETSVKDALFTYNTQFVEKVTDDIAMVVNDPQYQMGQRLQEDLQLLLQPGAQGIAVVPVGQAVTSENIFDRIIGGVKRFLQKMSPRANE